MNFKRERGIAMSETGEALAGLNFEKYKKQPKKKIVRVTNCESCVHYDYDEDVDAYVCGMDLDEDERSRFVGGDTKGCPYYRFYDEYKSVQKQN